MLRRLSTSVIMPKKNSGSKKVANLETESERKQKDWIFVDKRGCVMIRIQAKPGAKNNQITGITEEGVGVQINAPPIDGEANTELIQYLSSVLKIRRSDLFVDKGCKSRKKTVQLSPGCIGIDEVIEKLKNAIEK